MFMQKILFIVTKYYYYYFTPKLKCREKGINLWLSPIPNSFKQLFFCYI